MKWTTDTPTQGGWYWVKKGQRVEIVYIDRSVITDERMQYVTDMKFICDTQWAGPIPEPEE